MDGGFNDVYDYEDKDEKFEVYYYNKEDFVFFEVSFWILSVFGIFIFFILLELMLDELVLIKVFVDFIEFLFLFFFFKDIRIIWIMVKNGWLLFKSCCSWVFFVLVFVLLLNFCIFFVFFLGLDLFNSRVCSMVMDFFIRGSLIYCLLLFFFILDC